MKNITIHLELSSYPKKDGRHYIMLRLTQNRRKVRIITNIFTFKKDFNTAAKFGAWIRQSDKSYTQKNKALKQILSRAELGITDLQSENIDVTLNNLAAYIKGEQKETSFFKYAESYLDQLKKAGMAGTHNKVVSVIAKLKKSINNRDIDFRDIDYQFLKKHEAYLVGIGNKTNTRESDFKKIRAIFNEAIKEGLVPASRYPFRDFKLKTEKTIKQRLTFDEIKLFRDLELTKGSAIWISQQFFLLSFYTAGTRFSDLLCLQHKHIIGDRITFKMGKTGNEHSIKLFPPALEIIESFKSGGTKPDDYIFPLLKNNVDYSDAFFYRRIKSSQNTLMNKNLDKIAKMAKIKKKVTVHLARHSFSDIIRLKAKDLHALKNLLGHHSVSQTEGYINSMDFTTQDSAHAKLFED